MRRNTATLLVIIAALLAVDIALRVSPTEAVAQDQFDFEAARTPHVIQVEPSSARVYRLWSDGVIEYATWNDQDACLPITNPPAGMDWEIIPETVILPPGVRITRIYTRDRPGYILLRLRSDNVVEQNHRSGTLGWCGWRTPPG